MEQGAAAAQRSAGAQTASPSRFCRVRAGSARRVFLSERGRPLPAPPPPREDTCRRAVALGVGNRRACKAKSANSAAGARTCEGPWVSSSASSGQKLVVERDSRTAARGRRAAFSAEAALASLLQHPQHGRRHKTRRPRDPVGRAPRLRFKARGDGSAGRREGRP